MADSKHDAVWQWLAQCPFIQDMFFNFSQTDDGDTALIPSESVAETYIDGSTLRTYSVALTRVLPCSFEPNDDANIAELVDFEQLGDWVEEQNARRQFPAFPEGESVQEIRVLPNESGYVIAQDAQSGKYMLQFQIDYLKEAKVYG